MKNPLLDRNGIFGKDNSLATAKYIRNRGFDPNTLIDVGVSRGTQWFYDAFPDKPFILVDPLPDFESHLVSPPSSYEAVNKAVGSAPGELQLDIRGPMSSLNEWHSRTRHSSAGTVTVEISTLEAVLNDLQAKGPFGLKIDTEGHEIEVLRGLGKYAGDCEFIICETSIRERFLGGYRFSELIAEMKSNGFEFYNFISPMNPHPTHHDCLFLPEDSPLFRCG